MNEIAKNMNQQQAAYLVAFIERFEKEKPLYKFDPSASLFSPHFYGDTIEEFLNYFFSHQLINPDCYEIESEFVANRNNTDWYTNLTEKQILQCIGLLIRKDRFVDGTLATYIENGVIPNLLKRLKVIHDL